MTIAENALAHVRVRDVMHTGILTTDPSTPLRVVARLMADQRVHAVAVADPDYARRPWGFVTTLGVAKAAADESDEVAGGAADANALTVPADQSLCAAAQLMADNGVTHLIVIDPSTGHPSGIISSLDVAAAYAARS
jgi:predicted transcriptional regulator